MFLDTPPRRCAQNGGSHAERSCAARGALISLFHTSVQNAGIPRSAPKIRAGPTQAARCAVMPAVLASDFECKRDVAVLARRLVASNTRARQSQYDVIVARVVARRSVVARGRSPPRSCSFPFCYLARAINDDPANKRASANLN